MACVTGTSSEPTVKDVRLWSALGQSRRFGKSVACPASGQSWKCGMSAFAGCRGVLDRPLSLSRATTVSLNPYNIPDSSSSACSISSSLTTTLRLGTMKSIVEAQRTDIAKTAAVSGSVVVEWPPR
jgi:hypothetical protein